MKIFLGSTFTDLEEYRASVLRAIDRLRLQGYDVNWIGMEAFSAAAQTPLAECERYVDQAHLYVGVFGVRYGSKIPGTEMSFTEAEFRHAVERGIPLLLFLIDEDNAEVKPKHFERDPESLKRLTALKKEIGDQWKVDYFKSPEDLANKVQPALLPHLKQAVPAAAPLRADLAAAREQYATHLVDALDRIDATRIAAALDRTLERIALTDVYVPLKASVAIPERDVFDSQATVAGRKLSDEREVERARAEQERLASLPLRDALAKFPGVVILGDPGSGKSTFLKYAAVAFAQNAQTPRLDIVEPRLPIFVTIAAYAERLREGNQHQVPLADYFATYYRDVRGIASDFAPLFKDALAQGRALVLLDGLDEVKDPAERARVADHVEKFWNAHRTSGNRLVITSRIIGYEKLRAERLTHLTLHDFDDDAIKLFLQQWCPVIERAAESDPALAARNAAREQRELQDAIFRGSSGVRELAANPLLLTLLALIKRKGVRLPEQRVELYEEYVKALVETWALHRSPDRIITQTTKYAEVERVLAALALWMRETNPEAGTVDQPAIENWLTQRYGGATISPDAARRAAQKFVTDLRQGSGLIVERGHRVYGFIHQTLEEYLAAKGLCYLDDTGLDALIAKMRAREMFARDIWRETTLLAVGHLSVIQRTPHRAAQLVERFLREELSGDARGLNVVRAGEALRDLGRAGVTAAVCNATLQALQVTMQSSAIAPRVRAAAGESLDALGWLPDDLDAFVHIPEGDPSTLPAASLRAGFWIAKYPVTHHQYEKFVNAGGYANEKYWRDQRGVDENGRAKNLKDEAWKWLKRNGGAERRPALWDNPRFHRAGYPVIGVTWYEAAAYCAWMTEELQKQGGRGAGEQGSIQLPLSNLPLAFSNLQVRLPTEAEWVRAAGGEQNTRYPWDAVNPKSQLPTSNLKSLISNVVARANVRESEIGDTTPVAMYPDGVRVTEKGDPIWDLAGNVWEWTSTLYGGYEGAYVRGGSWYNKADDVSISSRGYWDRNDDDDNLGLRVVVASPNFPP